MIVLGSAGIYTITVLGLKRRKDTLTAGRPSLRWPADQPSGRGLKGEGVKDHYSCQSSISLCSAQSRSIHGC